jgi:NTE family protein
VNGTRTVLVLSGGGAKTAAQVGAWRAITEAGLEIVACVATSMGAVIGAALSAGRTPGELVHDVRQLRRRDIAALNPAAFLPGLGARSLLREAPLRRTIERLVPVQRFDGCRIPLTVAVTDLDSRELVWFGARGQDVPLMDALYATVALPLYYPPAVIGGRRYADGGLRAVLPLDGAGGIDADLLVAVDVGPGFDEPESTASSAVPRLVAAYNEATAILMATNTQLQIALWHSQSAPGAGRPQLVYIRPRVERSATFRIDAVESYAAEGHRAAAEALRDFESSLGA